MKKPKIVELLIDETEEIHGIPAISLVSNPALERGWVALSKDQFLSLAKVDEEKRTLVGVALIPEKHHHKIPELPKKVELNLSGLGDIKIPKKEKVNG